MSFFSKGNLNISASSHVVKNGNLDLESAQLDINPRDERLSKMNVISESIIEKEEDSEVACTRPQHVEGSLIYKGNSKVSRKS